MPRNCRVLCSALCLLALASLAGCHSCGKHGPKVGPVVPGVDPFETATTPGKATSVDFGLTPIPADFFCTGSKPFNGRVDLKGVPLDTTPSGVAGSSDTLVERLQEASFAGGPVTIPVKVRALRLTSVNPLSITCSTGPSPTNWRLDVCECGSQPSTDIVVKVDQDCGCGHFNGNLEIKTCLRFTNMGDNTVKGPLTQVVKLKITDMPWCPKPVLGALEISGNFSVKNCEGGSVDVRGTSNFFPGYSCAEQAPGVDCWTKHADLTRCHEGPSPDHQHCVNPVCGKRQG